MWIWWDLWGSFRMRIQPNSRINSVINSNYLIDNVLIILFISFICFNKIQTCNNINSKSRNIIIHVSRVRWSFISGTTTLPRPPTDHPNNSFSPLPSRVYLKHTLSPLCYPSPQLAFLKPSNNRRRASQYKTIFLLIISIPEKI